MGQRSLPVFRVTTVAAAFLAILALAGAPVAAQDGDVCYALTPEEVSAAVPGTYDAPEGMIPGTCGWRGTSSGGQVVNVSLYVFPPDSGFDIVPGAVETTIEGYPAFTMTDTTTDPPGGAVAVELGESVVVLIVSTSDAAVDLLAAASQLAPIAVGRVVEAASNEPAPDDAPIESTHPDPCSLFSVEELSETLGASLTAVGEGSGCRWDSADASSSVSVAFDTAGLTAMEALFSGGEHPTVAGQPAYQVDLTFAGLPMSQVSVDLGPDTISLLVSSSDPALDVVTLATQLMDTAFTRGLQVLPEPQGVATTCQLASPEEIAAAAGLAFRLTLTDYETFCTYEGGKGNKHVLIQVASQDPATIAMAIEGLGGTEIDGPGDRSWWLQDYGSLTSLQGDLALQVTVMPDKQTSEAKLQQVATAIMETLLAE